MSYKSAVNTLFSSTSFSPFPSTSLLLSLCIYAQTYRYRCKMVIIFLLVLATKILEASLVAQMVKNLPVVQETWVRSFGWDDPLENGYPL